MSITIIDAPGYERIVPVDAILLEGYGPVDGRGELSVVRLFNGEITVVPSSIINREEV